MFNNNIVTTAQGLVLVGTYMVYVVVCIYWGRLINAYCPVGDKVKLALRPPIAFVTCWPAVQKEKPAGLSASLLANESESTTENLSESHAGLGLSWQDQISQVGATCAPWAPL